MSLNTAHTDGGIVIHAGEMILLHAAATQLSFSGADELKYANITGNSYLTTHRLIFMTKGSKSNLKSFSFPFCVLSEVNVEQPVFGSNYLKGKVRAQPDGNWRGEAKFKLVFSHGGAIDFAQGMMRAIHLARQATASNPYWNAPPPAYSTVAGTPMPAPSSYYAPPANNYYGWMPPAYSFPSPEAGTVYVMEAPPPYPGLGQPAPAGAYPPQGQFGAGALPTAPPGGIYQPQGQFVAGTNIGFVPQGQPNQYAYANGNTAFAPPPPYNTVGDANNGTGNWGGNKKTD